MFARLPSYNQLQIDVVVVFSRIRRPFAKTYGRR